MTKINWNWYIKNLGMAVIDAVLVITAISVSVYLRFDWDVPNMWFERLEGVLLPAVLINLAVYYLFGFYRRIWRYASLDELMLIVLAVSIGLAGTFLYSLLFGMLPRSSYIIAWFLLVFLVGASRISVRLLSNYLNQSSESGEKQNALIVGAGEAGVLVARELKKHGRNLNIKLLGYVDDDHKKQNQIIQGLPVLGTSSSLSNIVQKYAISEVIIAMPSAPYRTLQEIIGMCEGLDVKIKTVPGIFEILKGQVSLKTLKDVDIEDLLRRPPVELDMQSISAYLANETVMITGAGGSIGAELCRQIAGLNPKKIILLDHDENGVFYIHQELSQKIDEGIIIPLVRDIQNRSSLEKVMDEHRPTVIFHAAAYKHVPLMETNTEEAIKNNVIGSKNIIDLASKYEVTRFVFVSTDKAVNPTSIMGATKRFVEIYLQNKARNCNSCIYCAVRFGNVLGSKGSVVLLFKEQIARGGPLTVTHPEMKRYFMTIPEAVQLVIQAGALGKGGEIFVLDMGEPIKIVDLARDMIILSGLKPEQDISIEYTGLRPGEKLYEELFNDREHYAVTRHERIFIAPDTDRDKQIVQQELYRLQEKLGLPLNALNNHDYIKLDDESM